MGGAIAGSIGYALGIAISPILGWLHVDVVSIQHFAEFGVGEDDRTINYLDAHGVSLAAIQGLHAQLQRKTQRVELLERQLAELEARLARLEALAPMVATR